MIQNITPITEDSKPEDIQRNFEAIQTAINNKQLAFHYLNLYNLKGSVTGTASAITVDYNLLNLNEALLIVDSSASWRNLTLNIGDYLVKTTAGPLKIPGPTTGYYKPSFDGTELIFTYTTEEPDEGTTVTKNIQGASGSGYDLTFDLRVDIEKIFNAVSDIKPIIQIYDSNTLIDYPYTLTPNEDDTAYTLKLDGDGANKTFTVRVR